MVNSLEAPSCWVVTLKVLRNNTLRIVRVPASSLNEAVAAALRPSDPGVPVPAQQLLRCVDLAADEIRFHGLRVNGSASAAMTVNGHVHELPLRLDLRSHSPSGFEWGYSGAGPAQLSLAICSQILGDEDAQRCYQELKCVFGAMHKDAWSLPAAAVQKAAAAILAQLER